MTSVVAGVYLCYESQDEALEVLRKLRGLYDMDELEILFFLGSGGHEALLKNNDFDLVNSGITLVTSSMPGARFTIITCK
jgi:hypothetical protein